MRLICPNCETEYEVHENMIPAEGRDVQCSNCMRTWFQSGPTKADNESEADLKLATPDAGLTSSESETAKSPVSDYEDDEDDLSAIPPSAVAAMAAKRRSSSIDDEALGVIHEEVAREQSARKSDAGTIETQIDLGIDSTEIKDGAAAARDRMRGSSAEIAEEIADVDVDLEEALSGDAQSDAANPAPKSDRLPDIEEINSTLAEAPDYDDFDDDFEVPAGRNPKAKSRRGFRLGFGLMLLISAALVGLHVYAPALSQSVPSLSGALSGYVEIVNSLRVWLDHSAQELVVQITKLLGTVN